MTTIALSLIACSSNEPSDPAMEAAKAVANNYEGTFKMYVMNNNVGESAMTVQIKDQKDGKVSLEIPETGSGSMVMSAFSLTDVLVTQNWRKLYTFQGRHFTGCRKHQSQNTRFYRHRQRQQCTIQNVCHTRLHADGNYL